MSASLRHLIVPELTTAAEVDGRVVAAAFGLLGLQPADQADRRPALSRSASFGC